MVRYSFLVRLSRPLLHAGFIPALSLITLSALISMFGAHFLDRESPDKFKNSYC
jgi:hypothetical protein